MNQQLNRTPVEIRDLIAALIDVLQEIHKNAEQQK